MLLLEKEISNIGATIMAAINYMIGLINKMSCSHTCLTTSPHETKSHTYDLFHSILYFSMSEFRLQICMYSKDVLDVDC
jgi:hypothetical protein